jgi:hypothetical protein
MSNKARHHRKLSKTAAPARGKAKPTRPRRARERASVEPMPLTVVAPRVEPTPPPVSSSAITLRSPASTLAAPTLPVPTCPPPTVSAPTRPAPSRAKRGRWLSSAWTLVALAIVVFALFVWSVADLEENGALAGAELPTVQSDAGGMESAHVGL